MEERLTARVYGRVQGVNFRHFVWRTAQALGITGWVRNRRDGSVEVVAEGPRERLDALLAALHEGPPAARVQEVEASWGPAQGSFSEFTIRPTV